MCIRDSHYFKDAFYKLGGKKLPITVADALLVWLSYYPIGSCLLYTSRCV